MGTSVDRARVEFEFGRGGMSQKKILLLEDDPNLGFVLQEQLESSGFRVLLRTNGEEGTVAAQKGKFDLCIVDVMMPKKDGFTFAREFRARDSSTPIIFLTAKSLKEDRIEGFKVGGDDYVTKPFSMEELLLRIQAVLKRSSGHEQSAKSLKIKFGKFTLDEGSQTLLSKSGKQVLTAKEAQVLSLLCHNLNAVVLRNDILKSIWSDDSYYNSRSLDVFISKLRKYLAGDSSLKILSVHGKGYKLSCRS
jgi:DNA-binding response OmpR family regulator